MWVDGDWVGRGYITAPESSKQVEGSTHRRPHGGPKCQYCAVQDVSSIIPSQS